MAKWGEGDPRWIVEERPDATNVNNWHWVEKNATSWSKQKIHQLFDGMSVEDDNILCKITEITKLEGEAMANNRKGKLIFFYEWVIEASWEGMLKAGTEEFKGSIEIPNLSEEHDAKDVDVNVTYKDSTDEAFIVKEFLRITGTTKIREQLATYIRCLKEEYGQGAILPTKVTNNKTQVTDTQKATASTLKDQFNKVSVSNTTSPKSKNNDVKTLGTVEDFRCSCSDLYRALTNQEMVQAYSGHDSKIVGVIGGNFSLFGGNITGHFTELDQDKKIVAKWRSKSWPESHYSDVIITLSQSEDGTKLVLNQKNIPSSFYEQTQEGWTQNYWGRIRTVFGFGSRIF